jgi:hypothetical protein
MKIFVPLKKHTARIVSLLIVTILMSMHSFSRPSTGHTFSPLSYLDSIVVEKQFSSKKHKVRLYPNADQQVLFFTASGEERKLYQLFVFDMDGTLVKQANIKSRQTTVITGIEKGVYLFEVFSNDERIETGKITVR